MMEQNNRKKVGHSIVTYRVRLYDRHFAWLKITKELYSKVVEHFFIVLTKEEDLLELSDFLLLRAVEERCIGTKEMKANGVLPQYPLHDFPKIPLYFRRSAINAAISLIRKHPSVYKQMDNSFLVSLNKDMISQNELTTFCNNCPMTLYKGMYQNFCERSIDLKLFNGEKWIWVTYPFSGREFPKEAEKLSPVLTMEKNTAHLLVPVSFEVTDIRTVKERMQTEECICAVSFPDYDVLAVAVVLSKDGKELNHQFFRGGKQKEHQKRKLLTRLQKSQQSRRNLLGAKELDAENVNCLEQNMQTENNSKENAHLYKGLDEINRYYAHTISHQILQYCLEQEIKVIVVPNYENTLPFGNKAYLQTNAYRWIGRSIIKKLKYKAFQKGIVVTSVPTYHISDTCSKCGATIRKYNKGHVAGTCYHGGKLFLCPNGHQGNSARNAANNIGKKFLSYWN